MYSLIVSPDDLSLFDHYPFNFVVLISGVFACVCFLILDCRSAFVKAGKSASGTQPVERDE